MQISDAHSQLSGLQGVSSALRAKYLTLFFVAPEQLKEADRVADRVGGAHLVRVTGADRHRGDAKAGAAGHDQHLGLEIEAARASEQTRDVVVVAKVLDLAP